MTQPSSTLNLGTHPPRPTASTTRGALEEARMQREKDHDEDVVDPDDASDDFANVDLNALENDEGNLN